MKVRIKNEIYDSNIEPILVILEDDEKELIANMGEQTKFCSFPDNYDIEVIKDFLKSW